MEALSDILQPYKDLVGTVAAIVTMGQMFSGTFMCYEIYKQSNTRGVPMMPFSGGLVMGILNLKYGFILRDDTMIRVNFFGIAISIVYLMIYFNYTTEKVKAWAQLGICGAFSAAVIGYVQMEDPKLVEARFGTILTAFMFYLIASPLFGLKEIIANKSTEGLPFPMILSGSVVTFMWLLYGIILKNNFIVLQNIVAFLLCTAQLSLFVIYPSKPKGKEKSKAKKAD
ncbi:sugar transporter SWEET1 [Choristoneura fumiferana]|uniref:sugar transporter SWEET1 n=1 Tax=Choristoneura fumiferana TaxID=7141 RepID=UPI003D15B827